ncbi:MAG TPA: hypothetical protein VK465_04145 [Fibrobacteria bacterium]|nr:hypothetical protein [Fibrobacteria bacterium]
MDLPPASLGDPGFVVFTLIGFGLVLLLILSLFARDRGEDHDRVSLDDLLRRITISLRKLSSPARAGGLFYWEAKEEVAGLLAELQGRMWLLDDAARRPYESRAAELFAAAARAGILVPPLETSIRLDSSRS